MKIGVLKEIKNGENRVALTPKGVHELVAAGHEVYVEMRAGIGAGISADDYMQAGAVVLLTAQDIMGNATLILKVKEPQVSECMMFKSHHILFTYMHLATIPAQAEMLKESGCTVIAYEMVKDEWGKYPLLFPMSVIAGRLATQIGAHYLQSNNGGSGILMGAQGLAPSAKVVVIGGGTVGTAAAQVAIGMGASVVIIESSTQRRLELASDVDLKFNAMAANPDNIESLVSKADLVIGSVLLPGKLAPKLVTEEMICNMKPGSVVVDVAIDQGGCFETSHPTSHADPDYVIHDVIHYCVPNMPAAVARTATEALTNATLPYVKHIANYTDWTWTPLHNGVCIQNGYIL